MRRPISISTISLEDFRKYRMNQHLYESFHEHWKPYLNLSSVGFFRWIYTDVVFYMNNHLKNPYDVDEYFERKYVVDGKADFTHRILFGIVEELIYHINSVFVYSGEYKKHIFYEVDNYFAEYRGFKFRSKIMTEPDSLKEQLIIEELEILADKNQLKPYYREILFDYAERERLKDFVLSISLKQSLKTMVPRSIQWIDLGKNVTKINILHKVLKKEGYIECNLNTFKKVFSNSQDYQKVKWLGTDFELLYLYSLLINQRLINVSGQKWKQLRSCFEYNTENESSILSQLNNGERSTIRKVFFDNLIDIVAKG